jgi:hypothetical protein
MDASICPTNLSGEYDKPYFRTVLRIENTLFGIGIRFDRILSRLFRIPNTQTRIPRRFFVFAGRISATANTVFRISGRFFVFTIRPDRIPERFFRIPRPGRRPVGCLFGLARRVLGLEGRKLGPGRRSNRPKRARLDGFCSPFAVAALEFLLARKGSFAIVAPHFR